MADVVTPSHAYYSAWEPGDRVLVDGHPARVLGGAGVSRVAVEYDLGPRGPRDRHLSTVSPLKPVRPGELCRRFVGPGDLGDRKTLYRVSFFNEEVEHAGIFPARPSAHSCPARVPIWHLVSVWDDPDAEEEHEEGQHEETKMTEITIKLTPEEEEWLRDDFDPCHSEPYTEILSKAKAALPPVIELIIRPTRDLLRTWVRYHVKFGSEPEFPRWHIVDAIPADLLAELRAEIEAEIGRG